jgi:hypothetical protein
MRKVPEVEGTVPFVKTEFAYIVYRVKIHKA